MVERLSLPSSGRIDQSALVFQLRSRGYNARRYIEVITYLAQIPHSKLLNRRFISPVVNFRHNGRYLSPQKLSHILVISVIEYQFQSANLSEVLRDSSVLHARGGQHIDLDDGKDVLAQVDGHRFVVDLAGNTEEGEIGVIIYFGSIWVQHVFHGDEGTYEDPDFNEGMAVDLLAD